MATNPISGKPDTNVRPTSSDHDEMPGALAEREARAYRSDPNYHRGTALAVVGSDGQALGRTLEETMDLVLDELRAIRLGMILAGTSENVDSLSDDEL